MGHAAPKTPYRPPPIRRAWRWERVGRRRGVLTATPYEDPPSLEAKLRFAEVAFLGDEIDVEQFERLVEDALRDGEPPPPGFRVVHNGQYVGPALMAYKPLPLERGL